jgi:histidyl-tRNA synthetase
MMTVQNCKGMRDYGPEEMRKFRFIEEVFRGVAANWGYREVRTPTLEYLHLFTSMGTLTPGMLRRVYSFLDWDGWSGERVVLRPDVTIPVARMYIAEEAPPRPAKYYYVTNVFRFEPTGEKDRERWQCGVELIGVSSAVADAELVQIALAALKGIGLKKVTLRLSHAGVIRGLLRGMGLDGQAQTELFDAVLEGDGAALARIDAARPELGRALKSLLDMTGKSSGFLKNFRATYAANLPEIGPALEDFITAADLFESLGADCLIDIAAGRGFEYYTGIMFQFLVGEERVAGGGRYDDLIPLVGGPQVPASGLALNMQPLLDMVKTDKLTVAAPARVLVKTAPDKIAAGFELVRALQDAGFGAEVYLGGQETTYRWVALVKGETYIITEVETGQTLTLDSAEAVLTALKKTGQRNN